MENGDRLDEELKGLFKEIAQENKTSEYFSKHVMSRIEKEAASTSFLPKWTYALFPIPLIMLISAFYYGFKGGVFNPIVALLNNIISQFNLSLPEITSITLLAVAYLLIARIAISLVIIKTHGRKLI